MSQFDDFRMNRDKAIALGTWLKIRTNISHFKIVSLETVNYKHLKNFMLDSPWKDFTAVTKLIKRFKIVHVLGDDYNNKVS